MLTGVLSFVVMYEPEFSLVQTVGEYFHLVDTEYLNQPPLNLTLYDDVAPVCYDAMWTLALALNRTIAGMIMLFFLS